MVERSRLGPTIQPTSLNFSVQKSGERDHRTTTSDIASVSMLRLALLIKARILSTMSVPMHGFWQKRAMIGPILGHYIYRSHLGALSAATLLFGSYSYSSWSRPQ